jgi:hypothetical protein
MQQAHASYPVRIFHVVSGRSKAQKSWCMILRRLRTVMPPHGAIHELCLNIIKCQHSIHLLSDVRLVQVVHTLARTKLSCWCLMPQATPAYELCTIFVSGLPQRKHVLLISACAITISYIQIIRISNMKNTRRAECI